ncbi:non-ribosomal peptide synthetase [Chitinophaga agri]|uniref:Amino acid adenylation domain-containing protein n=1 Tax=Chitinophaga agri TaxID=2703787 RepID=A0A6B9ZQM4_9BACT|nr:non-ribosomal peptide synthetase [Chitinophaga agri]QHS63363.1 amino acid adenylation domain-containing protein [Chitinophaga agri]
MRKLTHQAFEYKSLERPALEAISEDGNGSSITFEILNRRSNQLAHLLLDQGLAYGESVGVLLPAGIRHVSAMLAVFKAAGVYVPIDINFARGRLLQMFEETGIALVITVPEYREQLDSFFAAHQLPVRCVVVLPASGTELLRDIDLSGQDMINIDETRPEVYLRDAITSAYTSLPVKDYPVYNPDLSQSPDDTCYIFYTSGSTGRGKGIAGSHGSLSHYIHWHVAEWDIKEGHRVSQLAPLTFDASLKDIFSCLISGAVLCIPPLAARTNMPLLADWLRSEKVSILQTVPSLFRLLTAAVKQQGRGIESLRYIVLAGEKLYGKDVTNWYAVNGEGARLSNLYGLTETTILKTYYHIDKWDWAAGEVIPVGFPISNSMVAVISNGVICEDGELGDIYIKSPYISKGYLDKSLTARSLVQNPLVADKEDLVWLTGDLGRYRDDGSLEIVGRRDDQVKISGIRVELDEVRGSILKLGDIDQVELLVDQDDDYQQTLICYYTGRERSAGQLRAELSDQLNAALMPSYYVWLSAFPLNLNGKVDRKALPRPQELIIQKDEEPPHAGVEQELADLWRQVLKVEQVWRQDNFFNIGGSSLKAIQLISRIYKSLDVQLSIGELFSHPELHAQAQLINAAKRSAYASIPLVKPQRSYPLSNAQKRIWVLNQLDKASTAYNISLLYTIQGEVNIEWLQAAFNALIARHESLRTIFILENDAPAQYILAAEEQSFAITFADCRLSSDPVSFALDNARTIAETVFDLERAPLLKVGLFRVREQQYLLTLCMHHIVADEWSVQQVLLKELVTLYDGYKDGRNAELPPLPIQYKDYACWQLDQLNEGVLSTARSYWLKQFSGELPLLELPLDYLRPAVQRHRGEHFYFEFDKVKSSEFEAILKASQATLYMGLVALVNVLLYRYTGQTDIIVGSPVAGRDHPDLEGQIGYYVNTLAFRNSVDGDAPFSAFLSRVSHTVLDGFNYQAYPFDVMVDELELRRDLSRSPLIDVMVSLQQIQQQNVVETELSGKSMDKVSVQNSISKFDLTFAFEQTGGQLKLQIEYDTDLFKRERIERMALHLEGIMAAIVQMPGVPLSKLNYLSSAERDQLLYGFNDTAFNYPSSDTLVSLFEQQVRRSPDSLAVKCGQKELSYRELNAHANAVAHSLLSNYGVSAEELICLHVERNEFLLIGILGILKAGAAYLPLDPDYPEERIAYLVKDSGARLVLTDSELLTVEGAETVFLRETILQDLPTENDPVVRLHPGQLAYVLYTSGSTGRPKGVMIEHGSVVNLLCSTGDILSITSADQWLAVTTYTFDISVLELFLPLITGASVMVADKTMLNDPAFLQAAIDNGTVSIIQATPSMWTLLMDNGWKGRKGLKLLSGGEALNTKLADDLLRFGSELYNMYGPTETTIWSVCHRVKPSGALIPIGKPMGNTQVYVLDNVLGLCPVGVPGELCIGGAGLARGYLHNADLTRERFIRHPYGEGSLYRTGDMARWLPDGTLVYLGRFDNQIKLNGYRIELGEIEAVLASHESVDQAAVKVVQHNGEQYLSAYYTSSADVTTADLHQFLTALLPRYMVPAYFTALDALPLTAAGKTDRKALPDPQVKVSVYRAPVTHTARQLAAIWEELLGYAPIGLNDNFFALGGNSMKAILAMSRIYKSFSVRPDLKDLLTHADLAAQSRLIGHLRSELYAPVPQASPAESYPLSNAQRRLWVMHHQEGASLAYHIPIAYILDGNLHEESLAKAFGYLVARHEILRTVFELKKGEPRQRVLPADEVPAAFDVWDYRSDAAAAYEHAQQLARMPFDLGKGPLLRMGVFRLEQQQYLLLFCVHHIVSDGWSLQIMLSELQLAYNAYLNGLQPELPVLSLQYKDYACWQQQQLKKTRMSDSSTYWTKQLAGIIPPLELPVDYPRSSKREYRGAQYSYCFDGSASLAFEALLQEEQCTLFMGLLALVNVLLYRYTGQSDVTVGSPVAGREHPDLENQVGFYVNTLALRNRINGSNNFASFLSDVRQVVMDGLQHQSYPFDLLTEELRVHHDASRSSLFDVMVSLLGPYRAETELSSLSGLTIQSIPFEHGVSKFDLLFSFVRDEAGIRLELEYDTALYRESTVSRMAGHLGQLLTTILSSPDTALDEISYLSEEETHELLYTLNDNTAGYPEDKTLVDLFECQASQTPDHVAVVFGDHSLTYKELNTRSNRLAGYLRSHYHPRPDDLIGILQSRTEQMIICILGILKSGAGYVPIDVDYPGDRIDYMKTDSNCLVVLDEGELNRFLAEEATYPGDNPEQVNTPSDIAYVIYTSGTTGQPKGTLITHGNVVQLLKPDRPIYDFQATDVWTMFHSYCFDFSVWEMYGALLFGGRVVIVPGATARDPEAFITLLQEQGVTVLNQTPSAFYNLRKALDEAGYPPLSLRYVIFGGEALSPAKLSSWYKYYPSAALVNMYGITETTVHVTFKAITEPDIESGISNLGRPIPTLRCYVLDSQGQLLPFGVPGELYVGGAGVSRGYLNRASLTASRFIASPFVTGDRLYRTGDKVRLLENGDLVYYGRLDNQVKIRGYRIELGEIEAVLRRHEMIDDVVVLFNNNNGEEGNLVVYLIAKEKLTSADIRSFLGDKLPGYMMPGHFLQLEKFPLTPNGKLDRFALPNAVTAGFSIGGDYVAPRNDMERRMAVIWGAILENARVGIRDSFFELGGDSIKVLRLISELRKHAALEISIADVYKYETIEKLFLYVLENKWLIDQRNLAMVDKEVLVRKSLDEQKERILASGRLMNAANVADIYPMSGIQKGMVFESLVRPGQGVYHDQFFYQEDFYQFDTERFKRALQLLVDKHAILRTCFNLIEYETEVQIVYKEIDIKIGYYDVAALDEKAQETFVADYMRTSLKQPFDVTIAPLWRMNIFRFGEEKMGFVWEFHHAILDGWSNASFLTELNNLYLQLGRSPSFMPRKLKSDYKSFIVQEILDKEDKEVIGFWEKETADYTKIQLFRKEETDARFNAFLDTVYLNKLGALSLAINTPVKTIALAAYLYLLKVLGYSDEPVTGLVTNSRPDTEDSAEILGCFLNTIPLKTVVNVNETCAGFIKRLDRQLVDLKKYERLSIQDILSLGHQRSDSDEGNILFDVAFNYVDFHTFNAFEDDISGDEQETASLNIPDFERTEIYLSFIVDRTGGAFNLLLRQTRELKYDLTLTGISELYFNILKQIIDHTQQVTGKIDVLTKADREMLLYKYNDTTFGFPATETMVSLFESQAASDPEATAVIYNNRSLSYRELNERANMVAHFLRMRLSVKQGDLVAVMQEKSELLIVAMLGVLKAGGVYMPVDPAYPADRIRYMLGDSKVKVILADRTIYTDSDAVCIMINDEFTFAGSPVRNPEIRLKEDQLAYVIYTSGSTGRPKGVMVSHLALASLIYAQRASLNVRKDDRVLQFASISFDASVFETCLALANGAALVMMDTIQLKDRELTERMKEQGVTVGIFPASYLNVLNLPALSAFRIIASCGDVFSRDIVKHIDPQVSVFNLYGPTEYAVWASTYRVALGDWQRSTIPIGKPVANAQLYILGTDLGLQPPGVPGELCIAGPGLANGYLNNPSLTAARFVKNPYGKHLLYRTGDLARWLPDGNIEYLGRADSQVKIRGYRIELQEIEQVLAAHESISEAVVTVIERAGDKILSAYYTAKEEVSVNALAGFLKEHLPDYMIPAFFTVLKEFPLTGSGKINRFILPDPGIQRQEGVLPSSPVEKELAAIWEEVLAYSGIGLNDNFFDLGGHSLKAIQVLSRIHRIFSVRLDLNEFLSNPVMSAQCELISQAKREAFRKIPIAAAGKNYPLSNAQKRLWLLQQQDKNTVAYNIPVNYMLEGELDIASLSRSFETVIARHENLRTVFVFENGEPRQQILTTETSKFHLEYMDYQGNPGAVKAAAEELSNTIFDLSAGPLLRVALFRTGVSTYQLCLCMHHIISDEWSMQVLVRELVHCYNSYITSTIPALSPLPIQYKDYATWQQQQLQGGSLEAARQYWQQRFSGELPVLELPLDHPRPVVQGHHGSEVYFELNAEDSALFISLMRSEDATLFMGLLSLVNVLLYRYTGQQDIIIGTPVAGRDHADLEEQIGYFLNTLALRNQVSGHQSFRQLLQAVRTNTLESYQHQWYPFDMLIEDLGLSVSQGRSPLFDVVVILQNIKLNNDTVLEMKGVEVSVEDAPLEISKGDLRIQFVDRGEGRNLYGSIEYNTDLFERERIAHMSRQLQELLHSIVKEPDVLIHTLSYQEDDGVATMLFNSDQPLEAYPLMHRVFEQRVEEFPSAVAVSDNGITISYQALNSRSNYLARLLQDEGVSIGDSVGIFLPAGIRQVTGLLAVFKAGGVYVPMDISFAHSRLRQMLEETRPAVIITSEEYRESLAELFSAHQIKVDCLVTLPLSGTSLLQDIGLSGVEMIAVGDTAPEVYRNGVRMSAKEYSTDNLENEPAAEGDSYIYYTSGSTGKGKGIVGAHNSLSHYIHWHMREWNIGNGDRISQLAPVTFDASLKDILSSLGSGATLCVPSSEVRNNMPLLAEWLRTEEVSILQTVPSLFRLLTGAMKQQNRGIGSLRHVVLAGEKLYGKDVTNWYAANGNGASLSALYGLTETTILKSCYHIEEKDWEPGEVIPAGRAISGAHIAVINESGMCSSGELGDVYIRSPYLSKGYLDKSLTALSLVQNPLLREAEDLVWLTGDLGRYRKDGNLEILGRRDDQVKINGVRIELDEVRGSVLQLEDIEQVELLVDQDADYQQTLICYYSGRERSGHELRVALSATLNPAMLPSYYVWLASFPLNLNGKVDRKALPRPQELLSDRGYEAPHAGVEQEVAVLWQQVLGIEKVSRHDNFFNIGGSSLKAIQLISRIYKSLDVQLSIGDIFGHAELQEQASVIQAARRSAYVAIPLAVVQTTYPVSNAQKRLWLQVQQSPTSLQFNGRDLYRLQGDLSVESLIRSFDTLVARHESLRTVFLVESGQPRQQILPADAHRFKVQYHDYTDRADSTEQAMAHARAITAEVFDLSAGPLLRVTLFRTDTSTYLLSLSMHHIISDEWSMHILVKELVLCYNSYVSGNLPSLAPLPLQYKDYACWQQEQLQGASLTTARNYWLSRFSGELPVLALPQDRPHPLTPGHHGGEVYFEFTDAETEAFGALVRSEDATLFMGLMAVVKVLLYRYTGQRDIIIGTPVAGRDHPDLEGQIGYYLNTLALRDHISGEQSFRQLLQAVRSNTLNSYQHQWYPFDMLVEDLGLRSSQGRSPLFDVVMILQNIQLAENTTLEMKGVEVVEEDAALEISKGDLRIQFVDCGEQRSLYGSIEYNTDIFNRERIERICLHLRQLLCSIVDNPDIAVHQLGYLSEHEQEEGAAQLDVFKSEIDRSF